MAFEQQNIGQVQLLAALRRKASIMKAEADLPMRNESVRTATAATAQSAASALAALRSENKLRAFLVKEILRNA